MNRSTRRTRFTQCENSRRRRDDSGSTLIEAAFAMPIFVLLLFGIIEFSTVLMSYQGATNAVHAAGRVIAAQGNQGTADQMALLRLQKEAQGIPSGEVQEIIVWKATGPSDTVPANCKALTAGLFPSTPVGITVGTSPNVSAGSCNAYFTPEDSTQGAFALAGSVNASHYFGSAASDAWTAVRVDQFYPPTGRSVSTAQPGSASTAKPDYVGIWIKLKHSYYTGLFGTAVTITDQVVVQVEPQVYTTL